MKTKKVSVTSVFLAVLLIAIGYAAISTTLTITGKTTIDANASDFVDNIIFASATGANAKPVTLSTDSKTITFTTNTLVNVNDQSELNYTIKNNSQYGASIAKINCTSTDEAFAEYIEVTSSRITALTLGKGETSDTETVTFKLVKSYAEEEAKDITFTCSLDADALSAEA